MHFILELARYFPSPPSPSVSPMGRARTTASAMPPRRLLEELRREHPHLRLILIEDGLASNAPHIRQLKALEPGFILGVKPDDHKFLFERVEETPATAEYRVTDEDGTRHRFRYLNGVPLNDANFDLRSIFWSTGRASPTTR